MIKLKMSRGKLMSSCELVKDIPDHIDSRFIFITSETNEGDIKELLKKNECDINVINKMEFHEIPILGIDELVLDKIKSIVSKNKYGDLIVFVYTITGPTIDVIETFAQMDIDVNWYYYKK